MSPYVIVLELVGRNKPHQQKPRRYKAAGHHTPQHNPNTPKIYGVMVVLSRPKKCKRRQASRYKRGKDEDITYMATHADG